MSDNNNGGSFGLFGSMIAFVVSFLKWHSVGWAVIHGLLGWLYIVYYLIKY